MNLNGKMRTVIDDDSINATETAQFDLGPLCYLQEFVLDAMHADGTPAVVRILHSSDSTDAAGVTDALACERGHYEFKPFIGAHNFPPRYLCIYGVSNNTLLTVSRLS